MKAEKPKRTGFRLVIRNGERSFRFPLKPGEYEIGSSPECTIRISHPTVSRHHARITVSPSGVDITDLASSNGTRIAGRMIKETTPLIPGQPFLFGSVEAHIEEVEEGDIEAGVILTQAELPLSPGPESPEPEASTIGPMALEAFSFAQLPGLIERVAGGETPGEVARAVGAALIHTLPCRRVEILTIEESGVLFSAERGSGPVTELNVAAGPDIELRVGFVSSSLAQAFQPLVRVAAALINAARQNGKLKHSPLSSRAVPPRPPDPPTLFPPLQEIYEQAARIARSKVSVLIRGESGTGKELLARYLHLASGRSERPLLTLNCAALPRDLLESELFGVERGVATGVDARAGKFESANGGTLFLDEIGDMALETQARILRVLAEGEVYRIGSQKARPADVRIISATNRDLPGMLNSGAFRSDLYHRISDWVVELPPLRERRIDIPNLAAHFLGRACAELGIRAAGISRAALNALLNYNWPGNIRQLEKEMGRAALFIENGELLDTSRLQPEIRAASDESSTENLKQVIETVEKAHIEKILDLSGDDIAVAAERMGIGVSTLYRRMKALDIRRES